MAGIKKYRGVVFKAVLVIAGFLACIYYAWMLFVQDFVVLNPSNRENALTGAVHLAFGQIDSLKKMQQFSINDTTLQKCQSKNPHRYLKCSLLTPRSTLFYRYCGWWYFENCAVVLADPLFLDAPQDMKNLKTVLANPCRFLLREDPPYGFNDFSYYWRDLQCSSPKERSLRVVLLLQKAGTQQPASLLPAAVIRARVGG